ncbi:MAG: DUF1887 family protein [Desulfuromonadales bacterium]|nr:DUF1887 family protein [Desulfuromonadales bacterium]
MQIHTHLFLVNDDLVPNITPVLDPSFCPKKVFLMSSSATHISAGRLKKILNDAGVVVHDWFINDSWDIEHVREKVLEFVGDHGHGDIALNVTGGTKPMSLAAYEIFHYADKPVYYVNPENDNVVWMHPRDRKSFDLADRIKLPLFFNAHDLRIVSSKNGAIPQKLRDLASLLVSDVSRYVHHLAILNYFASESEGTLLSPAQKNEHLKDQELQSLIKLLADLYLLTVDSKFRLRFMSEDARFFVNGGWLEEHVYSVLGGLSSIQDLARNVDFVWDEKESPVKNEIDVAFLADNKLYLIECKTKNFECKQSDADEVLYKLDTLRDYLGGKEARAMFVSYNRIPAIHKKRSEELGIKVCEGNAIRSIEAVLREWVSKR